jgi:glycosyltransferase involved in cell wall biosynthesis
MNAARLPRITIITPSLNQGDFLEQTIQSVLSQEYLDLEYIVIDGGSTDATLSLLGRYEHSLRWISEADYGQSQAINKGLRLASGEVMGFLNADAIYEAGALRKVGAFFSSHPRALGIWRLPDDRSARGRHPAGDHCV